MSWAGNSYITSPNWSGNTTNTKITNLTVKNLTASNINTSSIYGYSADFNVVDASVVKTGYVVLNDTIMTTVNNILYVNGEAVFTPSSFSTISDWSYFPAKTDVIMSNHNINNINNVNASNVNASNVLTNFINASTILASNIVTYKINPIYISSLHSSTNILYASNATITTLYTSSFGFETAIGKDIGISSMLTNVAIFTPQGDDTDAIIGFASRDVNEIYGVITTSENRSSFSIGAANNLSFAATSSIQMYGADGIDMRTNINRDIRIKTTALGIDASGIIIKADQVNINANQINTNAYMSTNAIQADLIIANLGDFGILNASTINFDTLNTNNIINSSNIDTATLDVSGNASINNLTANGLTVNNSANYNTYISFGTSNSEFYGAQYLYDINSVRNLQVEKITVLGGWTGDDIIPPYYNDSIVEIGEDSIRPGQVTINGFNPDPLDTGTALTVRGDTQITQNLNVLGLTTLEGLVETIGDLNVDGSLQVQGDVVITGITTATGVFNTLGDANVGGILTVTGETNLLGAVTAEAGIGVVGAMGITAGNVTFGSSSNTGNTFTTYYDAVFNNLANFYEGTTFHSNIYANNYTFNTSLYGFNISQSNTIQHWNGTSYDYYIPQLSYTDVSNNTTAAVASDWAYYVAKKDLDMDGYNISNVGTINYINLIANNIYVENGYFNTIFLSNYITFRSPTTTATADLTFDMYTYSNGNSNDVMFFRGHPFLQNDGYGSSKNALLQVQATQYVDNSNYFCYLQFVDNEANVVVANESNVFQSQYFVAGHWSKYPAIQTVDVASNIISNVNNLGLVSAYGFNISQSNQVQHWNAGGGYYDYYIAQLSYTDISNNRTRAVASDWSYYPCENLVLDMSGGFITNVGGLSLATLGVQQATGGYINAGLVYEQLPGDEVFWQLSKPQITDPPTTPVGSEGIYIVERSTADGSEIAHGRLFDDGIYKPVIGSDLSNNVGVVGDLNMSNNSISNVDILYYGSTRQPFIQSGTVSFAGGITQTVSLPVSYVNSNYTVQATYDQDPGLAGKPLYTTTKTTSNFTIIGVSGKSGQWTTFGDIS